MLNSKFKSGLFFLPLGGVGEIGANCYLYCCDDSWIMIDLGVSFADEKYPGIEILVPDLDFLKEIGNNLKAIIISHGHEDHAGALSLFPDKIKCPVYASKFPLSLIKKRLKEKNLIDKFKLIEINTSKLLDLKNFKLKFIETAHSIPESYAILINTKYGNILHTADWKIDKKPIIGKSFNSAPFQDIGNEGLLALVGDSTNSNVKGFSGSESEVNEHLVKLFSRYSKRIIITCFSSNIARIKSIFNAAKKNNRKIAIIGRSIDRTIDSAKEVNILKNIDEPISKEEAQYFLRENIVIICTGSQGEKKSALYKIAYDSHQHVFLEKDDVVIFSSKDIPGNEKTINNLKNLLIRKKIEIITNEDEMVHVSGHAHADEMKKMYEWTRPYIAIPVHGESLHLNEHAKIAESCQVPFTKILKNGTLLKISGSKPEIIDNINTGKMIVEGNKLYNSESEFIKQRLKYSYEGMIMITILINNNGSINKNISISQYGLPIENLNKLIDNFKIEFVKDFIKLNLDKKNDKDALKNLSKKIVRKYCKKEFMRKPEVQTHIIYLDN